VSIASIDTGIWPQEELSHWERYRVVQSEPLDDSHGHGTHQAGAIGAKRDGGANIGAAFGARHVSINHGQNRVYDVSSWRVHLAIEVAAAQGARVVSLSLGDAQSSELSADAIRSYFYDTPGISFVAASGSLGLPNIAFPADMPETIAVGAINWPSGEVFVCSHHGPELDVVAYHGQITSYNPIGDAGNFFAVASNTSHANAQVASGVALLLSVEPGLSPVQVIDRVRSTAIDLGDLGHDDDTGYGRFDAYRMLGGEEWDVEVYGPWQAPPGAECTYTAAPQGGVPPYSWAWDVNGTQIMSGRSDTIPPLTYPLIYDPSTIRVRLMDSFFYEAVDVLTVTLDENGLICPLLG
jgi:subtilisin family serine protease